MLDQSTLAVKEFTTDFSTKSAAASTAALEAVKVNSDGAREASSKVARAAGKAHRRLEQIAHINSLIKQLHKECVAEEEEKRQEEKELKSALALLQQSKSSGQTDRRTSSHSDRRNSSASGHTDRRIGQSGHSDRRSRHSPTSGQTDRRIGQSGHSDRRSRHSPTSGHTDRRSPIHHHDRRHYNTARRINYYQGERLSSNQFRWTNPSKSDANKEPLEKRQQRSNASAPSTTASTTTPSTTPSTTTASTTAPTTVSSSTAAQLLLSQLTISEPKPTSSILTVPLPSQPLEEVSTLFSKEGRRPLDERCQSLFGNNFVSDEETSGNTEKEKTSGDTGIEPPSESSHDNTQVQSDEMK